MTIGRKIVLAAIALGIVLVGSLLAIRSYRRRERPLQLTGAVVRQNADPEKQAPIADVEVAALNKGVTVASAKSDFFGFFSLRLPVGLAIGDSVMLQFRHPDYLPLDEEQTIGASLPVVHLVPQHGEVEAELDPSGVPVTNVLIRYSTQTAAAVSVGTDATTFQVVNQGNVPCRKQSPCSPDGKWKAAVASASLDAGEGNVFRNARAFCIAGPCPFTQIDSDGFSRGGRRINISVRDWSDSTTFLLQAEVMHSQISDIAQRSYPLIFGRDMDFTVPSKAEGISVEAEINGTETIYPLGPNPQLSWAACKVQVQKNQEKDYRCELKRGFRFPRKDHSTASRAANGPAS